MARSPCLLIHARACSCSRSHCHAPNGLEGRRVIVHLERSKVLASRAACEYLFALPAGGAGCIALPQFRSSRCQRSFLIVPSSNAPPTADTRIESDHLPRPLAQGQRTPSAGARSRICCWCEARGCRLRRHASSRAEAAIVFPPRGCPVGDGTSRRVGVGPGW